MATIAVNSNSFIRPYRGHIRHRAFKEEASQTFKRGNVLVQDASAKDEVEMAGTDPTARIVGVAAEPASGVADTKILVCLAEPGVEFIGHIESGGTLAVDMVGTNYGLVVDGSNNIHRVDTTDTSNVNVTITELIDAVGDVNGRVAFTFIASARGIYKG